MADAPSRLGLRALLAAALLLLGACAAPPSPPRLHPHLEDLLPADVILLGEQHDADAHQALQRELAAALADRGVLSALLLEMAERGRSTSALGRDADEASVRAALAWDAAGWSWARYGPLVMQAVRQGVPVLGANLPRPALRPTMADASHDERLSPAAWARQQHDVREGHCGLLPESQIRPMSRVQVARDHAMAQAAAQAARPGRTVLLVAGGAHVVRGTGIPAHLDPQLRVRVLLALAGDAGADRAAHADLLWHTPALPAKDYCAPLRARAPQTRP